ncbi:MAG TPA: hypothetical protein VEB21_20360 [Terriglobales bacterium]|nr:hypothetical protein [Terriglobales bacterium]
MFCIRMFVLTVSLFCAALSARAAEPAARPDEIQTPELAAAKCEHGVKASICTRCNPKLEPVFKAKNDWCPEHSRPESQCSLCHPELEKQGIK